MIFKAISTIIFLTSAISCKTPPNTAIKAGLRPWIIAHRGSSGIYPEHTIAAYKQAIRDKADFIECDVLLTKDRQVVCLHDLYLSAVTDVAKHPEFADRKRKLTIPDYGEKDDWFCFDFTLDELKSLGVKQRFSFRDQTYNGIYKIPTFDEYVSVVHDAERPIGIYPELKYPEFINSLPFMSGCRFEDLLLDALKRHDYTEKDDLCFIQSFSDLALRYTRNKTNLRLVMLVWREEDIYGPFLNDSKLAEWATLYHGLGAWKTQIVEYFDEVNKYKNWISNITDLLRQVVDSGLKLHLYTFRNEDQYLAWNFKQDPINEYLYFNRLGKIEGFFTDFPHTMHRAFQEIDDANKNNQTYRCTENRAERITSPIIMSIITVIITFALTNAESF